MSYKINNSFKRKSKEIHNFSGIKELLKEKNLNPKKISDLKYLLSLTINPDLKKNSLFKFDCLLLFLLNYLNNDTLSIFTEFLFQSCELGSLSIVQILLENNLDINSRNELGETPLHIAIAKNDIELIKLLMEYEPKTNIGTYKDNLTAVKYAELCGNKNIFKLIKKLHENNIKEEIKNEVRDCINNDIDNIEINSDTKNFEQIQNFNGEKISIITDSDINSSSLYNNFNKNSNNNSIHENNKYFNTQQTIINESDYNEDISPIKKNIILFSKNSPNKNLFSLNRQYYKNNSNSNSVFNSNRKNSREIKLFSSSLKKKSITNNISINPSYIQSLTTCNTTNKDNKDLYTSLKFSKIFEFITEINLPKEYANYLMDNGFDNLDVLIYQAKHGIALTYENLRDIGIKKPGERIKIMVHLEEISENFNFFFPKNIFLDEFDEKNNYNSLKIFLDKIGMNKFLNNFLENGIYNSELLYIQMATKQPLTDNILINDLGINKKDAKTIIIKLNENSKNYVNKIKIMNKRNIKEIRDVSINNRSIIYEENNKNKSCDMCILF
jgi:ankyrin repeat protein